MLFCAPSFLLIFIIQGGKRAAQKMPIQGSRPGCELSVFEPEIFSIAANLNEVTVKKKL